MRIKITIIIWLMFGFAGHVRGASISKTVCASGCDFSTLKAAVDYIRTNGDGSSANTISIGAGTHTSSSNYALIDNAVTLNNLTIRGEGRNTSIINPTKASGVSVTANVTGLAVSNLTLKLDGGDNYRGLYNSGKASITFSDVDFIAGSGYQGNLVYSSAGTVNLKRCRFYHEWSTIGYRNPIRLVNTAGGTFSHCISVAAGHVKDSTSWSIESSGTVNIFNCLIFDSKTHGIRFSGTGAYSVSNSIISAGIESSDSYPIAVAGGSPTLSGNILIGSVWDGDAKWISGPYTDGGGNLLTNVNPKFTTYPRQGFIIPRIDDRGTGAQTDGYKYAGDVANLLSAKGMKGLYCIEGSNIVDGDYAALRSLVSAGVMEVGSHSYSHSDLTLADGVKIFDVVKGSETITIDRAGDTIALSGGGSVSGFRSKTLAAIKNELETLGATVTAASIYNTGSATPDTIRSRTLGEVIASANAANTINLLVDATGETGFYKTEMADQKTWLADTVINGAGGITDPQTGATYSTRSFCFPYNRENSAGRATLIALGFAIGNGGKVGGAGTVADVPYLGKIDMYGLVSVSGKGYLAGVNEEKTRYNARALAFAVAHTGLVIELLAHSTSELSLEQWAWALDEWAKYGNALHVTSAQKFRDAIAATGSGWTDDGNGTFTRTYTNGLGDYYLLPTSTVIYGGNDIRVTVGCKDAGGDDICRYYPTRRWFIGAYGLRNAPNLAGM